MYCLLRPFSSMKRRDNRPPSASAEVSGLDVIVRHVRRLKIAVASGAVETDFCGGMVRDNPEINRFVAAATALGRAGVPDDIEPIIAALLSDDNRWVNAQRIEVSGGLVT